jgi:LPXTG-motif cell wall-anchored protein
VDTTIILAIVGAVALLAAGGYLLVRWRQQQRGKAEAVYHFRCPGCKRRLRFHARQVGHKGACSNCGQAVVFPPVSQSID